mmetsp:Transcript_21746/g.36270  ORF Transcript_21746/g.36270 Transcript_21746/m.36270 type:complete len:369 (-) Transcript_21746:1782-2888(-)
MIGCHEVVTLVARRNVARSATLFRAMSNASLLKALYTMSGRMLVMCFAAQGGMELARWSMAVATMSSGSAILRNRCSACTLGGRWKQPLSVGSWSSDRQLSANRRSSFRYRSIRSTTRRSPESRSANGAIVTEGSPRLMAWQVWKLKLNARASFSTYCFPAVTEPGGAQPMQMVNCWLFTTRQVNSTGVPRVAHCADRIGMGPAATAVVRRTMEVWPIPSVSTLQPVTGARVLAKGAGGSSKCIALAKRRSTTLCDVTTARTMKAPCARCESRVARLAKLTRRWNTDSRAKRCCSVLNSCTTPSFFCRDTPDWRLTSVTNATISSAWTTTTTPPFAPLADTSCSSGGEASSPKNSFRRLSTIMTVAAP